MVQVEEGEKKILTSIDLYRPGQFIPSNAIMIFRFLRVLLFQQNIRARTPNIEIQNKNKRHDCVNSNSEAFISQ